MFPLPHLLSSGIFSGLLALSSNSDADPPLEKFHVVFPPGAMVTHSIGWLALWFIPLFGLMFGAYYLISLPLRRQERGRFFLHLIDSGLKQGRTPEDLIAALSNTQEASLGVRFHLLAAYIQSGLRLSDALAKVPRLLPPQITAMLKVGEEIGDLKRVLPACQGLLKDGNSGSPPKFTAGDSPDPRRDTSKIHRNF